MRVAEDFRMIARDVLNGKWKIAVLVGIIATLLGGVKGSGPKIEYNIDLSSAKASFDFAGMTIFSTGGSNNSNIYSFLSGGVFYIMMAALLIGAGYFIYSLSQKETHHVSVASWRQEVI